MKVYFVALLFASSLILSTVDTGSYDVQKSDSTVIPINSEDGLDCGPKTFSSSVKSAFKRESDLSQYSPSQLYLSKEWVLVFKEPYCGYEFNEIINLQRIDSYHNFEILSGTWIVKFQTGDLAIEYINELVDSDYIWRFYPLVEKSLNLRYEPNDPYYESGDQWYLDNEGQNEGLSGIDLNTQGAWNEFTGDGIVIGVVDDGIDYDNPDLSPNFLSQYSYDYCGNDTDVMPVDSFDDGDDEVDWHGTAVAGIVAGKGDNDIGIAGVAYNASLVGLRLVAGNCEYDYESESTLNDLAISETLIHELEQIDIYTNSWGPDDGFDDFVLGGIGPLSTASIEYGITEGRDGLGAIYTWANGNGLDNMDQSNKDGFANSRYTIAVGAVDWQGEQTWYSETGSNMLVSAPSANYFSDPAVYTTDISGNDGDSSTDYTSNMGGTSAATPMVAGVVALMLEANQNLTWRDVQHILVQTSRKVDADHPGWFQTEESRWYNHAYGYGLVDATAAVSMAKSWKTVDSEVVVNTGEITINHIIPDDGDDNISSTIIVNQSINIESIEVKVDVWHDFRGDLNFFLISPNGIVSNLVRQHDDPGDHYEDWVFTSVVHWDENSFGEWTLKVNDTENSGSYEGIFYSWNLTFYGTAEADDDQDGLPNYVETIIGTGRYDPDWDVDGLLDGEEFYGWFDRDGSEHRTNPRNTDTDGDGIWDWDEGFECTSTICESISKDIVWPDWNYTTDPNNPDCDDDGLLDGEERDRSWGSVLGTNPHNPDTDGDTLLDYNEVNADEFNLSASDPTKVDSDNDGMPDPYELQNGFNPMAQIDGWLDSDFDSFDLNSDGEISVDELYTNSMEYSQGTNPRFADTDMDGMYDGWEYLWGFDPLTPDSDQDMDNDTISNFYEYDNRLVESRIFSLSEPSLRAYWQFDGNVYTIIDDSDYSPARPKVHGVTVNNPTMDYSSLFDKGLICDGMDDYVELESLHNSKFNEYTIYTWVKLTNYTTDFGTVFGTINDGRTWLGVNSENYFEFRVFSGDTLYKSPTTNDSIQAKLGVWYNLAATYSESQDVLRLYLNGTLISELGIDSNHTIEADEELEALEQEGSTYNYMCKGLNGEYLNGTIDNFAVWDRTLNGDELNYVYERPLGFDNYHSFRIDDGIIFTNPTSNDTDNDGISDSEELYLGSDGYLTDPTNPDTDGDGWNDFYEISYGTSPSSNDTDGDNYTDKFAFDLNKTTGLRVNQTGDAFPLYSLEWNDTDGDGVGDNTDVFPNNSSEWIDTDGDGLGDNIENSNCIYGEKKNECTDYDKNDTDSDGIDDFEDIFPVNSTEWNDTDRDGVGDNTDACPQDPRASNDTDLDGYCDENDVFPDNPNEWVDTDGDGVGDNTDAYPEDPNRATKPSSSESVAVPISNYSLDSIMLVIVALGATYFVIKMFMK